MLLLVIKLVRLATPFGFMAHGSYLKSLNGQGFATSDPTVNVVGHLQSVSPDTQNLRLDCSTSLNKKPLAVKG